MGASAISLFVPDSSEHFQPHERVSPKSALSQRLSNTDAVRYVSRVWPASTNTSFSTRLAPRKTPRTDTLCSVVLNRTSDRHHGSTPSHSKHRRRDEVEKRWCGPLLVYTTAIFDGFLFIFVQYRLLFPLLSPPILLPDPAEHFVLHP